MRRWYPDPGAGCRGGAAGSAGGRRGDREVLPDEAVEGAGHEEGRENGNGEQGFLRNS